MLYVYRFLFKTLALVLGPPYPCAANITPQGIRGVIWVDRHRKTTISHFMSRLIQEFSSTVCSVAILPFMWLLKDFVLQLRKMIIVYLVYSHTPHPPATVCHRLFNFLWERCLVVHTYFLIHLIIY